MPRITKYTGKDTIYAKTKTDPDPKTASSTWWLMDKKDLPGAVFSVIKYLRDNQVWRAEQAALFGRLYCNLPIWNFIGGNFGKMKNRSNFPQDRPTYNVVQSCIDTLVSRMVQAKPKPMFITNGGDYRKRKLAKDLNKFIEGAFYEARVYEKREYNLRNSCIFGDGMLKIYESDDKKVAIDHVMTPEILVDEADGFYGTPQQIHQMKIMDRDKAAELFPDKKAAIYKAPPAYYDTSTESQGTIVSQIMVGESWHLKSGENAKDGRHVICCDGAVLYDEDYEEDDFPFVKMPYAPSPVGYWSQGMSERLMGLQVSINQLLYTQHKGLHLCAIPIWMIEDGSKVVSAHMNNQIGHLVKYQGTPPTLHSAQVFPPEIYSQLERYINMSFQQEGISQLAATSQKPSGLNSGAALREYDDIQTDRFAALAQRDEKFMLDLADQMFKRAKKIAARDGEYQTIYPGKDSLDRIDLPEMNDDEDDFIIQAYPVSALSKNPAFRKQEVIDLMQGGLIDPEEGRRLLDYPDIQQEEQLLNAPEERILKILDEIVEDGNYTPPDPFMDLQKAKKLCLQYYNKYLQEDLEEEKAEMLRSFSTQIDTMMMAAQQPPPGAMPPQGGMPQPQAAPMPTPQSPMVPNIATAA
jgi:hypothetical protein